MNSSLVDVEPKVDKSIEIISIPADDIANELGSIKCANMVAIGAYLEKLGLFGALDASKSLPKVLAKRYHGTLPMNTEALERGSAFAKTCIV